MMEEEIATAEGLPFTSILMFAVLAVILVVPFWQIWKRSGHSGFWGLLALLPLINLIALWILAFKRWPAVEDRKHGRYGSGPDHTH
jgi:hypothetical protein